jgi:uncharacterized protein
MPAQARDELDLGRLSLGFGDGRRIDLPVRTGSFSLGGHRYAPASERVDARVEVSRTSTGWALRLRLEANLEGPCVRCLEPATSKLAVEAREVEQPGADDEELRSPYMSGDVLDVSGWAHDAILLAMPKRFLCRQDCAGLCPVCGESLNDSDPAEHQHDTGPDPRWAKLRELKLE